MSQVRWVMGEELKLADKCLRGLAVEGSGGLCLIRAAAHGLRGRGSNGPGPTA